jgi:hypothetical protein
MDHKLFLFSKKDHKLFCFSMKYNLLRRCKRHDLLDIEHYLFIGCLLSPFLQEWSSFSSSAPFSSISAVLGVAVVVVVVGAVVVPVDPSSGFSYSYQEKHYM